ncbi:hypothetical protein D3C75_1389200 [compost metagenome]
MQLGLKLGAADAGSIQQLKALDRVKAKAHKSLVQEALAAENVQPDSRLRAALPQQGNC